MSQKQNKIQFIPIIIMIFLFGMISFVTNLASPMGDVLKNSFSVQNWMGTLGVFGNFIAYAIMGVPGGLLLQRKGYKYTSLIAIALGFVGVGIQTLSGLIDNNTAFVVYLIGAFVAGFSMCLLNIVVNPMLNSLAGGGNKGNQLIQIGGCFNSLCGTAVIMVVGILVGDIAKAQISDVFPVMFIALAIFALAFIVVSIAKIPERHNLGNAVKEEKSPYGPLSFRHFIFGAIGIFVYVGVEVGIPNVLQKFLQNVDLNVLQIQGTAEEIGSQAATIAGFVTGTYWILMLAGRLIGGVIGAKVSAKTMLTIVSSVAAVFVLIAIFSPVDKLVNLPVLQRSAEGSFSFGLTQMPISAAFLVLCGLCTSIMWGGIFNLAVEGLGKYTEKASGYFMVLVCGGGILPLLQNWIIDIKDGIGYLPSYWVVVAGLIYLLYYALIGSKNVNKNIPVE